MNVHRRSSSAPGTGVRQEGLEGLAQPRVVGRVVVQDRTQHPGGERAPDLVRHGGQQPLVGRDLVAADHRDRALVELGHPQRVPSAVQSP